MVAVGRPHSDGSRSIERIAEGYAEFSKQLAAEASATVNVSFILHGGEPLILPLGYLEQVVDAIESHGPAHHNVAVQTNAYRLSDGHLDFLVAHDIKASISNDVIPGVRRTAAGAPLEDRAHANALRLAAAGRLVGGITVLHRGTAPHLKAVHAYWTNLGVSYRLLPLFRNGGPAIDHYGLTEEESARALADFAIDLLDAGEPVTMKPLADIVTAAALAMSPVRTHRLPPLPFGRPVFVFNTDGRVYDQTATDYAPDDVLGDMNRQTLTDILGGASVQALLARDRAASKQLCTGCAFSTTCSGWPLLVDGRRSEQRCGVVYCATRILAKRLAAKADADGWWKAA